MKEAKSSLTHYSKSQIFVQKINFDKTPTFSPKISLKLFLVQSKLPSAIMSRPVAFSRFFHQKKIDTLLGKKKLNFWTKSEDFEKCESKKNFFFFFFLILDDFAGKMRGGPPMLYSSNQGFELLSLLSSSMSKSNKIPKTITTTPAPPQPVLWFPNNNADCGGSTKGEEEFFTIQKSIQIFFL